MDLAVFGYFLFGLFWVVWVIWRLVLIFACPVLGFVSVMILRNLCAFVDLGVLWVEVMVWGWYKAEFRVNLLGFENFPGL